ncbi:ribosomal L7Ae/L30e/S12e/Gadd45 family protein [Candidatus Woesearchaeota archaeon]|nr:ribosomal L7Ae/L30e/S12e/Gadd45 family protein [Candidatus Woesearchaeota archaeon]
MAKEQTLDTELNQLKLEVQNGTIVVGGEVVLKLLKEKGLQKVFLAKNCPQKLRSDVMHYARLAQVPLVELTLTNEELGIFCKKNFFVSVLGTRGA